MSFADHSASQKMIVLKSSDGETFEVEEAVAFQSQTIKNMIVDNCAEIIIPLPVDVASKILVKVIEYCKRYVDAAAKATGDGSLAVDEDLKAFDAEFVKVDNETLLDLITAAHYLKIKSLLDLTSQTVADVMKGMTPEEMRKNFCRLCDPNVWILPDE